MINNLKLGSLSLICLLFCVSAFGQEDKFSLNIELSPNISKVTDEVVQADSKLSFNGLARLEYKTSNRISPTIGIGFLNTGEKITSLIEGQREIEDASFTFIHEYIIIPIGAKFQFGKFYILPEIGLGIKVSNKTKTIINYSNGKQEKGTLDSAMFFGEINKISIPMFFSMGREFNLVKRVFSVGLKGYYGLNKIAKDVPRNSHYYGVGILLSMKL